MEHRFTVTYQETVETMVLLLTQTASNCIAPAGEGLTRDWRRPTRVHHLTKVFEGCTVANRERKWVPYRHVESLQSNKRLWRGTLCNLVKEECTSGLVCENHRKERRVASVAGGQCCGWPTGVNSFRSQRAEFESNSPVINTVCLKKTCYIFK